jgi:hypothetical protein
MIDDPRKMNSARYNLRTVADRPTWHSNFMLAARAVADWPKGLQEVTDVMMEYPEAERRERRQRGVGTLLHPNPSSGTPRIDKEILAATYGCPRIGPF